MEVGTDFADCAACKLGFDSRLTIQRYYTLPIWISDGLHGNGTKSVHNIGPANAARVGNACGQDISSSQVGTRSALRFWKQQSRYDMHGKHAEQRLVDLSFSESGTGLWQAILKFPPSSRL